MDHLRFIDKFRNYTAAQCAYALRDCHETLRAVNGSPEYVIKLWAEIDAIRARQLQLSKGK